MDDDLDLLRRYVEARDDAAFGQVVGRHAAFVHAIAARQTRGDASLADDVAQATFIVLARRAKHAARSASLRGWLHATTCYAAANARRATRRRARHERAINAPGDALDPRDVAASRDELAILDRALAALRASDRDAIVLCHIEGRPLAEVGRAIGTTPDAAKKRVQRAMTRLRAKLGARELALPTAFAAWLASGSREATAAMLPGGADGRAFTIARKVTTMMKWKAAAVPTAIAAMFCLAAGVALVVAQDQPSAASPAKPQAAAAPLASSLGEGVSVELLGLCDSSDPTRWWRPDGTPIEQAPPWHSLAGKSYRGSLSPNWSVWTAAFRVRGAGAATIGDLRVATDPPTGAVTAVGGVTFASAATRPGEIATDDGEGATTVKLVDLQGVGRELRLDLRASVAGGVWKTVQTFGADGEQIADGWTGAVADDDRVTVQGLYVNWSRPVATTDGGTFAQAFDDFPNHDRRLVAVDVDGAEHDCDGGDGTSATTAAGQRAVVWPTTRTVYGVPHARTGGHFAVPLTRIARFEVRLRERLAVQFSDVSLRAGAATDARVGAADPPRTVNGYGVDGPADRRLAAGISFDGEPLGEALAEIGRRGGFNVDVNWASFDYLAISRTRHLTASACVGPVTLGETSPITAVRAVFEAAGGRNFGLVVSDDGKTIYVVPGGTITRADGRAFRPGARN